MNFPKTIDVKLSSPVFTNFRCQVAANSLDIDAKQKSTHHLHIERVNIPNEWNVGLVYGASGSGKTTLAKHLFGENIFSSILNEDEPIINQLPSSLTYDECASILNGIGLNSVPCWIRPVKTLSNGQRARAEAALLMTKNEEIVFIDEWTSVVDRTVAKAMSLCIAKFAKKHNKKIVLLSCHYDILEWLQPDWLIDCNKQQFHLPEGDTFFFEEREELEFTIEEVNASTWKFFSKFHYLSERLPAGLNYMYGLFHNGNQIGFQCFSNYTPHGDKTKKIIYHSNRTVIHPDYNGLGLGIKLINETTKLFKEKKDCRVMAKFSAMPVFRAMKKQTCWKFLGEQRLMGKMQKGKTMSRSGGFREGGIRTFSFEYIGEKNNKIQHNKK